MSREELRAYYQSLVDQGLIVSFELGEIGGVSVTFHPPLPYQVRRDLRRRIFPEAGS